MDFQVSRTKTVAFSSLVLFLHVCKLVDILCLPTRGVAMVQRPGTYEIVSERKRCSLVRIRTMGKDPKELK